MAHVTRSQWVIFNQYNVECWEMSGEKCVLEWSQWYGDRKKNRQDEHLFKLVLLEMGLPSYDHNLFKPNDSWK